MNIKSMFQKDINRDINGVIKVAQDDLASLKQELGEYIITRELRRHFNTFFDNYGRAIDTPTDKIGVWISGFFGSGKSHFLKILSYLLSNREVDGVHAVDMFKDKFEDDPMRYAEIVRCASVPTEAILFNIDIEGPINKDKTAVLRVFAKVFYNHLGYYGEDLKAAKLEQFIDKQGKTADFRAAFERANGADWLESRSSYAFFEDDIVACLQSVLGMSETAARNWFNGEENTELSIKQLVSEMKEYVDGKGKNFRLLFCVDEVGQYIGDDSDLMINLQSIVEEVGDKCRGKVWVMVTSQEAIDSVVKISGDDFSKIQGRFNTRLSLSSSSVDEVIKKRVLAKTDGADKLLRLVYDKEQAVLKNLFTFNNAVSDLKGFESPQDFSVTYPFVSYQFIIIQKVLAEIRKHGNSGKHLSGGERSMLSGFQEAAQRIQDKDENALVPFCLFYDTVHTFLESTIRQVINRCQDAAAGGGNVEQEDVSVLKLLYLVRYIDDIKANIDNIAVLMVDDIRTDKIALRQSVARSLERLESQNKIARNGDTYSFLTDEEQDVANDISKTPVDSAAIVQSIGSTVFNDLYPAKKYKLNKYDFDFDRYVDDTLIGTASGGVHLRLVTVTGDLHSASEQELLLTSNVSNEAIIVMSDDAPYFEELEQAARIKKYIKQKNVSQLPVSVQEIIAGRQKQARALEDSAKEKIGTAIVNGVCYVHGAKLPITAGGARDKLDAALKALAESVYAKLNYVTVFRESDADILTILNSPPESGGLFSGANNGDAVNEISQWLEIQSNNRVPVSMGDVQKRYQGIPYGWREIDVAALTARLIASQKIQIKYGGAVVGKDDRNLVKYLRLKSEIDKASVVRRVETPEQTLRKVVAFLRDYAGQMAIPEDEDGLTYFVTDTLTKKFERYQSLINGEYSRERYPQKETVTAARDLMNDVLSQKRDNAALLNRLLQKRDELLNSAEDMEEVETFFKSQKEVFDDAVKSERSVAVDLQLYADDGELMSVLDGIRAILAAPKPYSRIKELPELCSRLKARRQEVIAEIQRLKALQKPVAPPPVLTANEPPPHKIVTKQDIDGYIEKLRRELYAKLERGEELNL